MLPEQIPENLDEKSRKELLFGLLTEIGIIHQLSVSMFNHLLPEGLHISHFGVINHLCRVGDGWTPLRIANAFQVTKATMTNTLKKLSARGLIEVRANPKDGRSKLVFITPEGVAFRERAITTLQPAIDRLDNELDLGPIVKTLPELQKLREYLDNNRTE